MNDLWLALGFWRKSVNPFWSSVATRSGSTVSSSPSHKQNKPKTQSSKPSCRNQLRNVLVQPEFVWLYTYCSWQKPMSNNNSHWIPSSWAAASIRTVEPFLKMNILKRTFQNICRNYIYHSNISQNKHNVGSSERFSLPDLSNEFRPNSDSELLCENGTVNS